MRTRTVLVLGVLLAAMAGGCANGAEGNTGVATARSGGPQAPGTPTASASVDPDAPLKYAKCMREQGMTWFPDPGANGRTTIHVPESVNKEDLKAAEEACRQWAPDGGERDTVDPQVIEKMRQMAKCMRENGVPDFPDPQPDGRMELNGDEMSLKPGDPVFDAAEEKCSQYLPEGAHTEKRQEGAAA